ncbi:MAG: nucleotidyltransferase domain-containing protein [Candidatus Thiodiazotropha sp.]
MNTDLTSLPESKRSDLQRIVALVREHCPAVGMIILYGSYARGDWKELNLKKSVDRSILIAGV